MADSQCPCEEELLAFTNGTLPATLADSIVAHLDSCWQCLHAIEKLSTAKDSVLAQLAASGPNLQFQDEPPLAEIQLKLGAIARDASTYDELTQTMDTDADPSVASPMPASIGDYELLGVLGEGGMGIVYKAHHRKLKRLVAVKYIPSSHEGLHWHLKGMLLGGHEDSQNALAEFRSDMVRDRIEVECQESKKHRRFVCFETLRRKMDADRFVELAKAILKRSPFAIMSKQIVGTSRGFWPIRDQEEPPRQQVQLSGLGVRLIDNDQDQSLSVLPSVNLVRAKFDGVLVTAFGWTARRTNDVLGGQRIKLHVGFQSTRETPVFRCKRVHHGRDRVARIESIIDVLCDRVSFLVRLVDETFHAIGGVNLPLPQSRVNESVAQSLTLSGTVVVAAGAQRCDQGMVDGLFVVAVIGGSVLLAVNFNWKAINVDRCLPDASSSGGKNMTLNTLSQAVSDGFLIGRVLGEDADQARLRWLTCQSLVYHLIAVSVPDGGAKRRVMSESIDIVLR